MDITVIPREADGAERKRIKARRAYYVPCQEHSGDDSPSIQAAIDRAGDGPSWAIPAQAWDRIFRGDG